MDHTSTAPSDKRMLASLLDRYGSESPEGGSPAHSPQAGPSNSFAGINLSPVQRSAPVDQFYVANHFPSAGIALNILFYVTEN
jgi:hypothetical protein